MTKDTCFDPVTCPFMCAPPDVIPVPCRYGLGQILIKQEKHADALGHFELACRINPASSVLRCCCGLALHKMGRLDEATRQLRVRGSCLHMMAGSGCSMPAQSCRYVRGIRHL